mgnify:CR=1 FL=1
MQRESLITNPQERAQLENLARNMGMALEELAMATTPVYPLLRNLEIGSSPGEFRLTDRVYRPVNPQQQQQQPPNPSSNNTRPPFQRPQPTMSQPNLIPSNLQNIGSILQGMQNRPQSDSSQASQNLGGLGGLNLGSMMSMMTQVEFLSIILIVREECLGNH